MTLWNGWGRAVADEGTEEEKGGFRAQVNKDVLSKAKTLARLIPNTVAKRREYFDARNKALEWLRRRGISSSRARSAWWRSFKGKQPSKDSQRRINTELAKL